MHPSMITTCKVFQCKHLLSVAKWQTLQMNFPLHHELWMVALLSEEKKVLVKWKKNELLATFHSVSLQTSITLFPRKFFLLQFHSTFIMLLSCLFFLILNSFLSASFDRSFIDDHNLPQPNWDINFLQMGITWHWEARCWSCSTRDGSEWWMLRVELGGGLKQGNWRILELVR